MVKQLISDQVGFSPRPNLNSPLIGVRLSIKKNNLLNLIPMVSNMNASSCYSAGFELTALSK